MIRSGIGRKKEEKCNDRNGLWSADPSKTALSRIGCSLYYAELSSLNLLCVLPGQSEFLLGAAQEEGNFEAARHLRRIFIKSKRRGLMKLSGKGE